MNPRRTFPLFAFIAAIAIAACSSGASPSASTPAIADDAGASTTPDAATTSPPSDASATPPIADAAPPLVGDVTCATPLPPNAARPPPLPTYSGGTCPSLAVGMNTLQSSGAARKFILVLPTGYTPGAPRPVLVMWHYIGGDAQGMYTNAQAQESADALDVIIAIPEKKGDVALPFYNRVDFAWPYLTSSTDARVEEEARFFDDMLACIAASHAIHEGCISTVGVSAGALWVAQLVQLRAERLASAIVISGGVGPALQIAGGVVEVRGWKGASRAVPTMVGWGGTTDRCGVDFDKASHNFENGLQRGGHFVVECVHNCGHAVPPVENQTAGLRLLYRFALDHPYWLGAGQSPYRSTGAPQGTPAWCGIGIGGATPRTGACPQTSLSSQCPPI